MRVLILDSNRLFGVGIKHFLQASAPDVLADYASSYGEAAARLGTGGFAALVLEIGTARDNGMRVLKRLRAEHPQLPMLVLSDYPVTYYGPKVIRAGACGFIGKDCEPDELVRAVRCILNGKHYISVELADQLALGLFGKLDNDAPHETLSPRELQIFRRLALGQSVTGIAQDIELSVKTVDTHRTKILRKMGMKNREELARYAFERRLIPSRRLGERAGPISDGMVQQTLV
jgi:two-component system invasion response regulator UvrY